MIQEHELHYKECGHEHHDPHECLDRKVIQFEICVSYIVRDLGKQEAKRSEKQDIEERYEYIFGRGSQECSGRYSYDDTGYNCGDTICGDEFLEVGIYIVDVNEV